MGENVGGKSDVICGGGDGGLRIGGGGGFAIGFSICFFMSIFVFLARDCEWNSRARGRGLF